MLSQKSIKNKIFLQLASTTTVLVVVFSALAYQILKINIMQNEFDNLINIATEIIHIKNKSNFIIFKDYKIVHIEKEQLKPNFETIKENEKTTLVLTYPYNSFNDYIILKKDITKSIKILDIIFISIFLIVALAISLMIFYSLFLAKILSLYLKDLSMKIAKFDDNFSNRLNVNKFPIEFKEIIDNINHLIDRIQNYNLSQKELFLGIAHELKTPLAVIKAKNDVTLMKQRDSDYYIKTIENSNDRIDNINNIISEILKIGRLESVQFEETEEIDLINFIKIESKNFSLLGQKRGQKIILSLQPDELKIKIQKTLFLQILQNFIQNAFKFSPDNSEIKISTFIKESTFYMFVDDNGCGISEGKDYFAPFKRFGDKEGIGLGLYLSKTAATALKAKVELANRKETQGTRAIFSIKIKN